jgi:hypothetical protein
MKYLSTNGVLAMAEKYDTPFYYVQDDFWMDGTNVPNGIFQPEPHLWPHGMKVIADYAHSLGMKFGLYPQATEFIVPISTGTPRIFWPGASIT